MAKKTCNALVEQDPESTKKCGKEVLPGCTACAVHEYPFVIEQTLKESNERAAKAERGCADLLEEIRALKSSEYFTKSNEVQLQSMRFTLTDVLDRIGSYADMALDECTPEEHLLRRTALVLRGVLDEED